MVDFLIAVTYAIIDATEVFIQTSTDLQLQSSPWSSYKHHNTAKTKILVACTPNGAICYVSLFVGSISDVDLTRVCGFINKLDGKEGIWLTVVLPLNTSFKNWVWP